MIGLDIEAAIKYFEYGIKCDIFQEPVVSYAKLAVQALKHTEMINYKKLLTTIKRSLGGILPCHQVGRIAERVAEALVEEGVTMRKDEGK